MAALAEKRRSLQMRRAAAYARAGLETRPGTVQSNPQDETSNNCGRCVLLDFRTRNSKRNDRMNVLIMRGFLGGVYLLVLLLSPSSTANGHHDLGDAQRRDSELVVRFIDILDKRKFDDARVLFHVVDNKVWDGFVAQFAFVRQELGAIKAVELTDAQLTDMERTWHHALKWETGKTDGEFELTKSIGIRFDDGSLGIVKGTVEVKLRKDDAITDKPRLRQLELIAPLKNRKFTKFYRSFLEEFKT